MLPLIVIFIVGGVIAGAALVWLVAISLLRPSRMTDGKALALLGRLTPDDIGIAYEPVTFQLHALTIAGWWMPATRADAETTVLLLHGFADAKVGAIAWAPLFHTAGLNCLAIDLRAHGESGGKYCTLGEREAEDVGQVINEIRAARPTQTRNVVLFGASMGGVTALRLAAERDDLAGVIADSPYANFRTAIATHSRRHGLPGAIVQRLAIRVAAWIVNAGPAHPATAEFVRKARCSVLIILPETDDFITTDEREGLVAAVSKDAASMSNRSSPVGERLAPHPSPLPGYRERESDGNTERAPDTQAGGRGKTWLVPNAGHLLAMQQAPADYVDRVYRFLVSCGIDLKAVDSEQNG